MAGLHLYFSLKGPVYFVWVSQWDTFALKWEHFIWKELSPRLWSELSQVTMVWSFLTLIVLNVSEKNVLSRKTRISTLHTTNTTVADNLVTQGVCLELHGLSTRIVTYGLMRTNHIPNFMELRAVCHCTHWDFLCFHPYIYHSLISPNIKPTQFHDCFHIYTASHILKPVRKCYRNFYYLNIFHTFLNAM